MSTRVARGIKEKNTKYDPVQQLLKKVADGFVNSLYSCQDTILSDLLKEKFTWIVGCHLSPFNTFKDISSYQLFRLCSITKTDDDKSAWHEMQLLEIGTSKIQGAGRGVFAAKSFEKDDIISVYLEKKTTDTSTCSLEKKACSYHLTKRKSG